MSCDARQAVPCTVGLRLLGWTAPGGVAHVAYHGYPGSYPPQLVLEHLVPVVQCRLELVRASANKAEQSNSWSDHREESPSSCEHLPSSMHHHRAAYPKYSLP